LVVVDSGERRGATPLDPNIRMPLLVIPAQAGIQ
jgi:hypothetical protein